MTFTDFIVTHIKRNQPLIGIPCTVSEVQEDKNTCTCKPINSNLAELLEVRLNADDEDKGIVAIPAIDSFVYVMMIDNQAILVQTSDIDKYKLKANNEITVNSSSIVFNGGENKGLVKVEDLVSKLNNLENNLNTLTTEFKAHIHTSASPGSPTTTITVPSAVQNLQTTTINDLENPDITH